MIRKMQSMKWKNVPNQKKIRNPKIIMRETLEISIEGYSTKCCYCYLVAQCCLDSLLTP